VALDVKPEDCLGGFECFVRSLGDLNPAGLASTAGLDLGLGYAF
jgi:hypothetical protein